MRFTLLGENMDNNASGTSARRGFVVAAVALVAVTAAACGGGTAEQPSDSESPTQAAPSVSPSDSEEPGGGLDALVAAANEEGALTVYSEHAPDSLNELVAAFEELYPEIDVDAVREVHNNIAPDVEIELESGNGVADVFITTFGSWFEEHGAAGDFLPLAGPELSGEGEYESDLFVHEGSYFEVSAAVAGLTWNTNELPEGISNLADLLDPELDGRVAIPQPTGATQADWYYWLEDQIGSLDDLAALNPRVYESAVPANEGVVSGEVAVTPYGFTGIAAASVAVGAPIDFGLPEGSLWGAPHYAAVLRSAPNPNAGMLFANFLVTRQAQEIIGPPQGSSVLPGIEGAGYNGDIAESYDLSEQEVTDFIARFEELFVG